MVYFSDVVFSADISTKTCRIMKEMDISKLLKTLQKKAENAFLFGE